MTTQAPYRVVVVGGGFGGLSAVQALGKENLQVTLIDKRNFHLFQPLLYQVATGALSPANIATPLRALVKRQRNTRVLLGDVVGIDPERRGVQLSDGDDLPYDSLIIAAGMRNNYFGHDEWQDEATGLKTLEDATAMRAEVLSAFEQAERETDPEKIKALLTFIVVGGGATGVELAGALAEIARYTLRGNFRHINPADAQIILVEGLDRLLTVYPEKLSAYARKALERMGVQVRLSTFIQSVDADGVTVKSGDQIERILSKTVLWGAGVRGVELGKTIAERTGAQTDKAGRVIVNNDCSIPNHADIFVIGDLAHFETPDGKTLPGVAQVAKQQGAYVAHVIHSRRVHEPLPAPFVYRDLGNMATIGRAAAVADLHTLRFTGLLGWLSWLFIHLMQLVTFQNRALVLLQWAYNYLTRNRAARLITNDNSGDR